MVHISIYRLVRDGIVFYSVSLVDNLYHLAEFSSFEGARDFREGHAVVQYYDYNYLDKNGKLLLNLTPQGIDGTIEIRADRPWASQGILLGKIELKADMKQEPTEMSVMLPDLAKLEYKRAIFFVFKSETKDKSICTLHDFVFAK